MVLSILVFSALRPYFDYIQRSGRSRVNSLPRAASPAYHAWSKLTSASVLVQKDCFNSMVSAFCSFKSTIIAPEEGIISGRELADSQLMANGLSTVNFEAIWLKIDTYVPFLAPCSRLLSETTALKQFSFPSLTSSKFIWSKPKIRVRGSIIPDNQSSC